MKTALFYFCYFIFLKRNSSGPQDGLELPIPFPLPSKYWIKSIVIHICAILRMYGTQSFEYTKPAIYQPSTTGTASVDLSLIRRCKKKKTSTNILICQIFFQ